MLFVEDSDSVDSNLDVVLDGRNSSCDVVLDSTIAVTIDSWFAEA
jgi:hypothetical protein